MTLTNSISIFPFYYSFQWIFVSLNSIDRIQSGFCLNAQFTCTMYKLCFISARLWDFSNHTNWLQLSIVFFEMNVVLEWCSLMSSHSTRTSPSFISKIENCIVKTRTQRVLYFTSHMQDWQGRRLVSFSINWNVSSSAAQTYF